MKFAFEPMKFAADSVNEFYNQAAIAAIGLFDVSDSRPMAAVDMFTDAYQGVTSQIASVLDLSNYFAPQQPAVAGASFFR
jgi:hypothetical protein